MRRVIGLRTVGFALVIGMSAVTVQAWEIHLKECVTSKAALIRLGDVADITGTDDESVRLLRSVKLAPGATISRSRLLSAGQIRGILERRGVDLEACQFTGAPRVCVEVPVAAAGRTSGTGDVRSADWETPATRANVAEVDDLKKLEQVVKQAVLHQLEPATGATAPWRVEVAVARRGLLELPDRWQNVSVEGIRTPMAGRHQAVATFSSGQGEARIPVEVRIVRSVRVVVAAHPIQRGQLIRSGDVTLEFIEESHSGTRYVDRLEDAIGREALQSLPAGRPIAVSALRQPLVVRRRDEIEVIARQGAVLIRRRVLALSDGARGDTITVESLDESRSRFLARVVGVRKAEVLVSPPQVEISEVRGARPLREDN